MEMGKERIKSQFCMKAVALALCVAFVSAQAELGWALPGRECWGKDNIKVIEWCKNKNPFQSIQKANAPKICLSMPNAGVPTIKVKLKNTPGLTMEIVEALAMLRSLSTANKETPATQKPKIPVTDSRGKVHVAQDAVKIILLKEPEIRQFFIDTLPDIEPGEIENKNLALFVVGDKTFLCEEASRGEFIPLASISVASDVPDTLELEDLKKEVTKLSGDRVPQASFCHRLMRTLGLVAEEFVYCEYQVHRALLSLLQAGFTKDQILDLLTAVKNAAGEDTWNTWWTYRALPGAVNTLLKAEFTKDQILDLVTAVKNAAGERTCEAYYYLPNAVNALLKAEYTKDQILDLLTAVANAAGKYTGEAYQALPDAIDALLKAEYTKDQILDLLTELKNAAGEHTWWAYKTLPNAVNALLKAGFTKDQILDLLTELKNAANEKDDIGWIYNALPDAIDALLKAEFTKDQILDLVTAVKNAAGERTWEAYYYLPNAVNALLNAGYTKDQILGLLTAVKNAAEKDTGLAYQGLPGAIGALLQAGYTKDRILDLLTAVANAAGKYTGEAYQALPLLLAGIGKDRPYTFKIIKQGIVFVTKYSGSAVGNVYERIVASNMDIAKCTTKARFAKEYASAINRIAQRKNKSDLNAKVWQEIALDINAIHGREGKLDKTDIIRETIAGSLDTKTVYYLFSLGGADLYTLRRMNN